MFSFFFFYGAGTRHEKALTTNIPRVCDLEETIGSLRTQRV